MVVKTIYIARHGYRSNWLAKGPYPLPPTGIDSDVPLAEHGIHQAKELAHYIVSLENQPELLFSSPFYRCIQTSEPIADILELPIMIERGIGEWYRPDRPVIPVAAPLETLENFFPGKLDLKWQSQVIPSDKGETEEDLFRRCGKVWPLFINQVETQYPNAETILLVTHAAAKAALGMNLLGFSNWREPLDEDGTIIRSGSCSLDKYELDTRSTFQNGVNEVPLENRKWRMTMNGNVEFLIKGEEMNWDYRNAHEAGSDADIKLRQAAAAAAATGTAVPSVVPTEEPELESVYVSVDIPNGNYREGNAIDRTATLQQSGLETDVPLFRVGDQVYEGQWKKLVGTELAFPGEPTTSKKQAKSVELETPNEEDVGEDETDNAEVDTAKDRNSDDRHQEKIYRIQDHIVLNDVERI
ncbi:uncharacterized protein TDEL_0F01240 [Torulaspora delbrueckii]|uniref:Transcription factor TFIIIC triple barrel domain-containing protein n=1 Tax=Torulaspora delbrueckii TaxID=4950 RepID=G8ZWE1_TORDE|nr:hypothetical protein TDEL_0F01240 [Torulaspora delbrueckii]CCE92935.1 hypothetical protein TDEL_0F01240 [Torulaspora delbrueckii]